jgi:hypothetical protein
MRGGLRADVLRLRERNIAVVLDNETVKARLRVSSSIRERRA